MSDNPEALAADIKAAVTELADGRKFPDLLDAIDRLADLAQQAATPAPAGWKLVPIEPTQAMIDAVANSNDDEFYGTSAVDKQVRDDWAAMLAATPAAPPAAPPAAQAGDAEGPDGLLPGEYRAMVDFAGPMPDGDAALREWNAKLDGWKAGRRWGTCRPCHNCDGLGYRHEANGEPIPCDLCEDDAQAGDALPPFNDDAVQTVYALLCSDECPIELAEHWEGWVARRIVATLAARGQAGDALPPYTDAAGRAGQDYHARFPHAHPLPALWRWQELWDAMARAALKGQPEGQA